MPGQILLEGLSATFLNNLRFRIPASEAECQGSTIGLVIWREEALGFEIIWVRIDGLVVGHSPGARLIIVSNTNIHNAHQMLAMTIVPDTIQ